MAIRLVWPIILTGPLTVPNSQWNEEEEGVRGTSMWDKEKGAGRTYQFEGTKAYGRKLQTLVMGNGCLMLMAKNSSDG